MNCFRALWWVTALAATSAVGMRADCIPFDKAPDHVGEIVCVRGRVVKVSAGNTGTHYLNFCENYLACPFTVVVFAGQLEDIGDVRSLQEREIEIDGLIKLYNGRAEIVLSESKQLRGEAALHIPPLPKKYDVTQHGNFSAGTFRAKKPRRSKTRRSLQDQTDAMSEGNAEE
jgi:hypothetical protein